MKKALLSVVAAGLVATAVAPAALAVEKTGSEYVNGVEEKPFTPDQVKPAAAKAELDANLKRLAADTPKGQTAVLEFEGKRYEVKGTKEVKAPKAAKTQAPKAGKALPKTSAVK